jgi:hypothetical protein
MRWHKRIRLEEDAINLAADIDAVVAINRGAPGTTNRVDSVSSVTVVQDSRRGTDAGEEPIRRSADDRRDE